MCMFAGPSDALQSLRVGGTRIFARADGEQQVLVYSMDVTSAGDIAMVLPIPVPAGLSEAQVNAAVELIDLEGYPGFFQALDACFPEVLHTPHSRGSAVYAQSSVTLVVHDVGDYEASVVPSRHDFDRLDPRFRLAPEVVDALTGYADWAFAVFQLKTPRRGWVERLRGMFTSPSPRTIHPMALRFQRRDPDRLFFPTVHSHHGEVPPQDEFDHQLFWQAEALVQEEGSARLLGDPSRTVDLERAKGLVHSEWMATKRSLRGRMDNGDHWVSVADPAAHLSLERPV